MKLLFIATYYYPHWTGLTQYARRLAEGLCKKKFQVSVLTVKHDARLLEEENVNGVWVSRKPVLFRISRTLVSPLFLLDFFKKVRQNDKIIVYLPFAEVLLIAFITKLYNKKLFLVHNGDLVLPTGLLNRFLELVYFFSTYLAIRFADSIIIQTEDYGKQSRLLTQVRDKWKVALPLYEQRSLDRTMLQSWKQKYSLDKQYIVGFSGRFVEEKGHDILLAAIPHVIKLLPQTRFIFSGDTSIKYEHFFEQNRALIDKYSKDLIFLGTLDQNEMQTFYHLCDVFVISSRTDCFPSTQVEALLAGTPVVATNIPGTRWVLQQIKGGLIVAPDNSKIMADGIIEILQHKKKYTVDRGSVEKLFDYEKTLTSYIKLLENT